MDIPSELRKLAQGQDGIITRQQAMESGLSKAAIRHALAENGPWKKIIPGVYATFTGPLQQRHRVRAALLYAGDQAMVTGAYACRAYGMQYVPRQSPDIIELLVPANVRRAPIPIAKIRRVKSLPPARVLRDIPCAPPERAALDACRDVESRQDVRAALCEVVQRQLTKVEHLLAEFGNVDRRGMAAARRALDDVRAGCRSAPECELRDVIRTSMILDEPVWNEPLPDDNGLIPDGYYREVRLALEVDSVEHHGFGDRPELTEQRRARYAALGWRVISISPRRIRQEPKAVLAEIEAAYLADTSDAA
jgi:hypothetical protein